MRVDEQWRPVVGYEGLYEVSNLGRVRALPRRLKTWFGDRAHAGGIMRPKLMKKTGYLEVSLQDSAGGRSPRFVTLHAIVAEAFHGPKPSPAHEVLHGDGVRTNCAASNLRWGTRKENMEDQRRHGTLNIGAKNGNATITQELADWVRESSQNGPEIHH